MISITGPAIVSFLSVTDEAVEFFLNVTEFAVKKSYSNLQPLVSETKQNTEKREDL